MSFLLAEHVLFEIAGELQLFDGGVMSSLFQDIRYGFRMLAKNPGFTLVVITALALGIGVNTALFSVVYGILLKPLPYAQGKELVVLQQNLSRSSMEALEVRGQPVRLAWDRQHNRKISRTDGGTGSSGPGEEGA